ncbi:MAG: hypothetical protein HDR27_08195 [Lachnospiraceae bacterium]|nr:hypothetical protein [Lachnospiraceae bacterium]
MNVIIKSNLRHHFILPFLSAIGILLGTALIFPVTALKGADVGRPLECLLPFAGAALLGSVFLPEQDKNIRDVMESKKMNCSVVYAIRLLYSAIALIMLVSLFVGFLYLNECEVHWFHLYGSIASAFFVGSIGFTVSGLYGNTIIGYMAVVIYYLVCYGLKKQLGVFWLFRMGAGIESGKTWLFVGGVVLIAVTFVVLEMKRRR